jgi:hypothetical protein
LKKAVTGRGEYSILLGWYTLCCDLALGDFSASQEPLPTDTVTITVPFEHRFPLDTGVKINLGQFTADQKVQVILYNAWPIRLSFGNLDSMSSDVLISELVLHYDDFAISTSQFPQGPSSGVGL